MNSNDENVIRPVHYLGSKLRMLDSVKEAVDSIELTGGCICDLFSGSGTISNYFLNYRDVVAIDIQNYSKVLCEASMSHIEEAPEIEQLINEMQNDRTCATVKKVFSGLIEYENSCIKKAKNGELEDLYEIIEKGSLYIFLKNEAIGLSDRFANEIFNTCEELKNNLMQSSEDTMITRYFGGLYFSYAQAVEMDCIAHIVFKKEGLLKIKMLAALLSTASEVVNTIGKQFAQPLKVRDSNGNLKSSLAKKILNDRNDSVLEIYIKWISFYFSVEKKEHEYRAISADYLEGLEQLKDSQVKVIYADPPYTRYHYSRYYHVLETICLRDNPNVSTTFAGNKGGISRAIYREDRHQSPFCIKSQAEIAFNKMFEKISELNVPLVLSYSPFDASRAVTPRLQTIEQLVNKALNYFDKVEVISPGEFTHSKLNSTDKNFEANHEAELLIVCKNIIKE